MSAALDLRSLARTGPVHFMGISGAGMSALAEVVLRAGGRVTGCDLKPGAVGDALRRLGAAIVEGHDPAHVTDAVALVTTSAVPQDHPELVEARQRGIPVLKRAEALGALVNRGEVLAVAGTHGKTTTTAMAAAILEEAGLDPTAFVGGRVPAWGGGLRPGSDRLFVVEADEYDRSFLRLRPRVAVVTTVEADHLDIYGTYEGVQRAFEEFVAQVPEDGLVVACVDDPGARRILETVGAPTVAYGFGAEAELRAVEVRAAGTGSRVVVEWNGSPLGELTVAVPGEHNVRNALGAFAAARRFGAGLEAAKRALSAFRGVERRFQVLGEASGVVIVDDYAHHPSEIDATLAAARRVYPERRLVAVFQPHLYTRTRDFAGDFGRSLAAADVVWVTDVYPAREAPIPGVNGGLVADAVRDAGAREVHYHPRVETIPEALGEFLRPGDVCVLLGAGSITEAAHGLHGRLARGGAA